MDFHLRRYCFLVQRCLQNPLPTFIATATFIESEPEEFQPPPNSPPPSQDQNDPSAQYQPLPPREEEINAEQMRKAYDTLIEIFPSLDTNILKDVIFINRGNIDVCIDACLQLVDG